MLKRKALRKMLLTTITVFILMIVYLIPTNEEESINTNLEVEYLTGLGTNYVYLLNPENYLVKTPILISSDDKTEQVKQVLETLTISNNSTTPMGLKAIIPTKTKVNSVNIEDDIVNIDFSNEFFNIDDSLEESLIESITFSILNLDDIEGVKISIENTPLTGLPKSKKPIPEVLTKNFGINKEYHIKNRNNINKVIVYYTSLIDNTSYYVPVTKYVNDEREKIKIIVEDLTSHYIYEPNLMSFLNSNTELLDYSLENETMILNFSDEIFTDEEKVLEEVIYTICYSIFDNYEVEEVVLQVDSEVIVSKNLKENLNN